MSLTPLCFVAFSELERRIVAAIVVYGDSRIGKGGCWFRRMFLDGLGLCRITMDRDGWNSSDTLGRVGMAWDG